MYSTIIIKHLLHNIREPFCRECSYYLKPDKSSEAKRNTPNPLFCRKRIYKEDATSPHDDDKLKILF